MNTLSQLPIDIFIQNITYLPFSDVVNVCHSNSKLHNYCMNPKYNNSWKVLIDNTFSKLYHYQDILNKVWRNFNMKPNTYNYIVYTQLIKFLSPVTQLNIYYRQGDMKLFRDPKFSDDARLISLYNKIADKFSDDEKYYLFGIIYSNGVFKIISTYYFYDPRMTRSKYCEDIAEWEINIIMKKLNIPDETISSFKFDPSKPTKEKCKLIENRLKDTGRVLDLRNPIF